MKKLFIFATMALFSSFSIAQTQITSNKSSSVFEDFSKLKKSQVITSDYNDTLKSQVTAYLNIVPSTFDKKTSQYFIVVDSSFKKQNLMLAFWDSTTQSFQLSSNLAKISTGRTGKVHHYITPTGWLEQIPENGTYRAQGTKNSNGIRGYGVKGMRVWDFGWQNAYTGWMKRPEVHQIRMQMHATDPQFLEQRLGNPASQGCIRLSSEINQFLDNHAIIDKNIENSSMSWSLKKVRNKVENQGSFVLIVNTDKPDSLEETAKLKALNNPRATIVNTETAPVLK